jgi:hypothetical protein
VAEKEAVEVKGAARRLADAADESRRRAFDDSSSATLSQAIAEMRTLL